MRNMKLKAKKARRQQKEERTLPDFVAEPPQLRRHNVSMNWEGARYRFAMTIGEDEFGTPVIELGRVYTADEDKDEWIEMHHRVLAKAKADVQLMLSLRAEVEIAETRRIADEMADLEWR